MNIFLLKMLYGFLSSDVKILKYTQIS